MARGGGPLVSVELLEELPPPDTIAIGVVKGSLLRVWSWDGVNFLAFAPILVLAGILIPITVKRVVLSRAVVLDRMTG